MAQWLDALATVPEALGSRASTHVDNSQGLSGHQVHEGCTDVHADKTHVHLKTTEKRKVR